jgi:NADPH:quinone reductase-like Zn-dependent oxidoreductase
LASDHVDRTIVVAGPKVVATEATMKAIVQSKYGAPGEVLELQELARPVAKDDEVLVRVHAASIHVGDVILARGLPYFLRMMTGLRRPKNPVPGTDIAGTVAGIGKDVTQLRPGDEVFGWCAGAFAEYACAGPDHFVLKPANLSFEQAAAVGVSATTALQLLRDQGKVLPGQKVLINGASGGVGPFAVQIAKAFGAEVTGVCGPGSVDMVRSIGADHVIDYTKEDFTEGGPRYDFILDNVANHSMSSTRRALTPGGKLQTNGGGHSSGRWIGSMGTVAKAAVAAKIHHQQLGPSVKFENSKDLAALKTLVEAGTVTPVIDRTYPLSGTAEAIGHVGEGHARGTVVITV